jgi:hypothetical protein
MARGILTRPQTSLLDKCKGKRSERSSGVGNVAKASVAIGTDCRCQSSSDNDVGDPSCRG